MEANNMDSYCLQHRLPKNDQTIKVQACGHVHTEIFSWWQESKRLSSIEKQTSYNDLLFGHCHIKQQKNIYLNYNDLILIKPIIEW